MLEGFSQRLREARLDMRLDQLAFADLGGVKKNSQVNYEAGRTPPTVEYLYRLADHGVDIGYILTGRRSDSSLSFEQVLLTELFEKMSAREREAVMQLMMTLTGQTVSAAEIGVQAREARTTLQDRRQGFHGKDQD